MEGLSKIGQEILAHLFQFVSWYHSPIRHNLVAEIPGSQIYSSRF